MKKIGWLDPDTPGFPPLASALDNPNGLLAAGGDLSPERLLLAYRSGIFPWYEADQPILWWSPNPRSVLFPEEVRISRSLRKRLRRHEFEMRLDSDFAAVIEKCSGPRDYTDETWLTDEMKAAYLRLHTLGYAHAIEAWQDGQLVGGLYGVCIGRIFFGESMFHDVTDASKVALVWLSRLMQAQGVPLIDCQVGNDHMERLGARGIPREVFTSYLAEYCAADPIDWAALPTDPGAW